MKTLIYEQVTKKISYNPKTGEFVRLIGGGKGAKKGTITKGCLDKSTGYLCVCVCGIQVYAHRLAWFLTHGSWPLQTIDHINRDRTDNRMENLRDVSYSVNNSNMGISRCNTSGLKNISWHAKSKKWMGQIKKNNNYYYLGLFESKEKAEEFKDFFEKEFASPGFVSLRGLK